MNPKEKIIEATFLCIAEKGSSSFSLRDVSKKAGVALSQIHYYFSNKEGLLVEAAAQFMKYEQEELKEKLKEIKDPKQRIQHSIIFLRDQQVTKPTILKVYFELLTMSMTNSTLAEETKKLQEQWVNSILHEDMNLGISQKPLARFIVAFLDGLALQTLQGASLEELEETFVLFQELLFKMDLQ
jgi:AcrR family transcriptional regulator